MIIKLYIVVNIILFTANIHGFSQQVLSEKDIIEYKESPVKKEQEILKRIRRQQPPPKPQRPNKSKSRPSSTRVADVDSERESTSPKGNAVDNPSKKPDNN